MDKKKVQEGSSKSSFTSQLFGPQESSSNDVFGSIFQPPKEVGQNSGYGGSGAWLKNPTGSVNQPSNSNYKQDNAYRPKEASAAGSKERNSVYQQGAEPCYMSSSLYYGGQESYSQSTTQSTSTSYPTFKKDGREDDPSVSARGDWWQGSLYY